VVRLLRALEPQRDARALGLGRLARALGLVELGAQRARVDRARVVGVVARVEPRLRDRVQARVVDLRVELGAHRDRARALRELERAQVLARLGGERERGGPQLHPRRERAQVLARAPRRRRARA